MHRLVPELVAEMGAAYPELVRAQPLIEATLLQEETRFRQTLANGLKLLDEATAEMGEGGTLPGRNRVQALRHLRLPLRPDRGRAARSRAERRPRRLRYRHGRAKGPARAAWKGSGDKASDELWFDLAEEHGATEFTGYSGDEGEGVVLAIVKDGAQCRQRQARRDGHHPAQPDAILRRKRRAGWRRRKTDLSQGLCRRSYRHVEAARPAARASHQGGEGRGLGRRDVCTSRSMPSGVTPRAPTTARRTCSTPRCATGSAGMSRRRAAWSRPTGCGSTSRIPRR